MFTALDATLNWKVSAELVSITVFLEAMKNTTGYRLAGNNKKKKKQEIKYRRNVQMTVGSMVIFGCNPQVVIYPGKQSAGSKARQRNSEIGWSWILITLRLNRFPGWKHARNNRSDFRPLSLPLWLEISSLPRNYSNLFFENIIVKAIDRFPILISIWVSMIIRRKAVYRPEGGGQRRIAETEWYRKAEYYTQ